jgi:hypothetical protein
MPPSVILMLRIIRFLLKQIGLTTNEAASLSRQHKKLIHLSCCRGLLHIQWYRSSVIPAQYLKNVSVMRGSIQTTMHTLFVCYLPFLESTWFLQSDLRVVVDMEFWLICFAVVLVAVVQYSSYCVCCAQCVWLFSFLFILLVSCFQTLERKRCCSCSCCFVLMLWSKRKQEKTREEKFRKDRTNGEEVMLLRFDRYKCTWVFDSWLHGSNGTLCTYISTYQYI